jgi:hypothetical protein
LALSQYQSKHHNDGIYSDEALFSAEIYNNKLQEPDKSKTTLRKLFFNHEDSIYFVEARKSSGF